MYTAYEVCLGGSLRGENKHPDPQDNKHDHQDDGQPGRGHSQYFPFAEFAHIALLIIFAGV